MSVRMHCRACRTAFVTRDDSSVRSVICPKCGEKQPRPGVEAAAGASPVSKAAPPSVSLPSRDSTIKARGTKTQSVFVPSDEEIERKPRQVRRLALGALGLLILGGVGVVVALPYLQRKPVAAKSADPVHETAIAFLKAIKEGDAENVRKLSTVELPPAIRSFRSVKHDPARDSQLRGKFGPIAAFHTKVNETYVWDESAGRFTPKNPLGQAAETLDTLHEAKDKAEKDGIYKKMQSGNPEDLFDAAEGLGKVMTSLAEGALSPKNLIPTYKMLIDKAKPPLPPMEKALVLDYAEHRETWDTLLKRPFMTLKADGPYVLERAEVSAMITDALGSAGDPPTPLSLTLTRFQFEGINTGWKVTSSRRGLSAEPPLGPAIEPLAPPKKSPGEIGTQPPGEGGSESSNAVDSSKNETPRP